MANLLVTGGAGFLGGHLVDALVQRGNTVTVFDRAHSASTPVGVRVVLGELGDVAAVAEAVAGQDAGRQFAGEVGMRPWAASSCLTAPAIATRSASSAGALSR